MIFRVSYRLTSGVAEYVRSHIGSFIDQISDLEGVSLDAIKYIGIGTDYEKTGRPQPFILVSPSRIDFDQNVYQDSLQSELGIDCLISVDGYDSDTVLKRSMLYADALTSLVTSDDQLGGLCEHAEITHEEFYPGGSGNRHYAIVSIALTEHTET